MNSDSDPSTGKTGLFSRWRRRAAETDPAGADSSEAQSTEERLAGDGAEQNAVSAEALDTAAAEPAAPNTANAPPAAPEPSPASDSEPPRGRFLSGLARTRQQFGRGLANLFLGQPQIDANRLDELEVLLLGADVGVGTTQELIEHLTASVRRRELSDGDALLRELRRLMVERLAPCAQPLAIDPANRPHVIMVVGVNGVGKTTTIGKLANRLLQAGHRPLLAAGDTFRAAAVEQLQTWGERTGCPVIAQRTGADSASVIFDAIQAAQARDHDVVIADTAGRLHNKSHLMEELSKVVRVMRKLDQSAPHEVLLVLDGGTGQNAVAQAREFSRAVPVSGLAITKLDGTARGGVLFSLADAFSLPVRFVGLGEGATDLQPFDAEAYVDALLGGTTPGETTA